MVCGTTMAACLFFYCICSVSTKSWTSFIHLIAYGIRDWWALLKVNVMSDDDHGGKGRGWIDWEKKKGKFFLKSVMVFIDFSFLNSICCVPAVDACQKLDTDWYRCMLCVFNIEGKGYKRNKWDGRVNFADSLIWWPVRVFLFCIFPLSSYLLFSPVSLTVVYPLCFSPFFSIRSDSILFSSFCCFQSHSLFFRSVFCVDDVL